MLGQSKGGDLALALAVTLGSKVASFLVPVSSPASSSSQIRAVATLNGCIASAGGSTTHSGMTVFHGLGLHPHFLPRPRLDGSLDFLGAMQVRGLMGKLALFSGSGNNHVFGIGFFGKKHCLHVENFFVAGAQARNLSGDLHNIRKLTILQL